MTDAERRGLSSDVRLSSDRSAVSAPVRTDPSSPSSLSPGGISAQAVSRPPRVGHAERYLMSNPDQHSVSGVVQSGGGRTGRSVTPPPRLPELKMMRSAGRALARRALAAFGEAVEKPAPHQAARSRVNPRQSVTEYAKAPRASAPPDPPLRSKEPLSLKGVLSLTVPSLNGPSLTGAEPEEVTTEILPEEVLPEEIETDIDRPVGSEQPVHPPMSMEAGREQEWAEDVPTVKHEFELPCP